VFIDLHGHAYREAYPGPDGKPVFSTPEQLISRYDELGVEKGCLLPIVNPEVYLPQSNEEILSIARQYPGRFIPYCNIDPRAVANSSDADLGYLLRYYKDQGCRGIGEVMPNLPFTDPLVWNLFGHAQSVGLPLTFDISARIGETYGLYDDPGLPQLEASLQAFPDLIIVCHGPAFWAEITELESPDARSGYPSGPVRAEGAVARLLRSYPNMRCDLSAYSGYNALARDPGYGIKFLNEFSDRLLFGLDICAHDEPASIVDLLKDLKAAGQISETAFAEIARENAIELLGLEGA
jgi:predicted TIM-barrel fold metal-dependent hydrolase